MSWQGARRSIKPLVIFGGLVLCGCVSQRGVLYQRGNYSLDTVRDIAKQRGLRLWPTDTSSYLGLVIDPAVTPAKGTVVVFHGNAGIAPFRSYYGAALQRLGYRVVLAEYPGYGGRPGRMSEKSFTKDAVAVLKEAEKEFGRPLYVWGESLGSAVAAAAVGAASPGPDGVVLLTPWDSLLNLARAKFPHLPVRLFLRDKYDSVSNLAAFGGPTAIVLAREDEVIPIALGQALHQALPGTKHLWVMPGVGHNDWSTSPANPMWAEIMSYLSVTRGGLSPATQL